MIETSTHSIAQPLMGATLQRRLPQWLIAAALVTASGAEAAGNCEIAWPLWQRFVTRFVQNDGRVINLDTRGHDSVSEAQAYALVLSLVANDARTFGRLLTWTRDNLAAGDLTARLPAWQWGKRPDGTWGVLDPNSASDADSWLAYALLEAGRLWNDASYEALGKLLMGRVARSEVADLGDLGPMLIPGASGFQIDRGWRLNPSYMPLPVLRRFALADPEGPWDRIAENTVTMIKAVAREGFAPDWAAWTESAGFTVDPEKGDVGSFDAIRVYLWAGMTHAADPLRAPLVQTLTGMARAVTGNPVPPRSVRASTGEAEGVGPVGFSAALLPFLAIAKQPKLVGQQDLRVTALLGRGPGEGSAATGQSMPGYYDSMLTAFGRGWMQERFRFDKQGRLIPQWRQPCETPRKSSSRR